MPRFYDGTKLLSLLDINGRKPEIYICTSNRSAGKTTYFNRLCVNGFIKRGEKFMLLYRFDYELDSCAEKFFKDINKLFFPNYSMESVKRYKGKYHDLYLQENKEGSQPQHCGYAVALNGADVIKKLSHLFSDTSKMLFDEFQSETNHYCPDEVTKFISVHKSVARGNGKMARYLPVYMIANPVTLLNPYYVEMDISSRMDNKTRFLKGNGFVLEQGYNADAEAAAKESGFNAAFSNNKYIAYSGQGVYLNDNDAFIETPTGRSRYLATLKYNNGEYGVRSFDEKGVIYIDNRPDITFPTKLTITTEDHDINWVMLRKNDMFLNQLRYFFDKGCFRFKDLKCKEVLLKALSY